MRDVIVVGGGPAGSCAAAYAGEEKDVLLLEKGGSPLSVCAGGLTSAMVEKIKPDFPEESVQQTVKEAKAYLGDKSFEISCDMVGFDYFLKVVDREKFDKAFLEMGEEKSEVLLNTPATGIEKRSDYWKVHTPEGEYKTEIVVLADGAPSKLARKAGIDTRLDPYDVSSCVLDIVSEDYEALQLFIQEKYVEVGYAGILPAGEKCKVGICEESLTGRDLRKYLETLKENQNIDGGTEDRVFGMISSAKPLEDLVPRDNLALAGDAARLCRPYVGGGIDLAVASGRLLGKTIAKNEPLEKYDEKAEDLKDEVNWFYSLKNQIYEDEWEMSEFMPLLSKTFFKHYQYVFG